MGRNSTFSSTFCGPYMFTLVLTMYQKWETFQKFYQHFTSLFKFFCSRIIYQMVSRSEEADDISCGTLYHRNHRTIMCPAKIEEKKNIELHS